MLRNCVAMYGEAKMMLPWRLACLVSAPAALLYSQSTVRVGEAQ